MLSMCACSTIHACRGLAFWACVQAEVNQGLQEGLLVLKQQKALAEALAEGRGQEVQGLKQEVKDLTGRLTEAESRVQQGELIRRKLHNTILVRSSSASFPKNRKHLEASHTRHQVSLLHFALPAGFSLGPDMHLQTNYAQH